MKTLEILHWIVEVIALAIIASAMFTVGTVDFRGIDDYATTLTIAQIIVVFTCIPGGYMVKKCIDSLFKWVEKELEETEE